MTEKEILALEEKRYAAMAANDIGTLDKLLHPDLIYTHSSGAVDSRARWLEQIKSGHFRYKKVTRSQEKVRVYGDTALVTGRATVDIEVGGEARLMNLAFLAIWTGTPQGPKFVGWQACLVKAT